jgi:outer membrane protein TolC
MRFPRRRFARKVVCLTTASLGIGLGMNRAYAQNIPDLGKPSAPVFSATRGEPLQGPILSQGQPPLLPAAKVEEGDHPLPINLATALRLADARPLVIAAAQASLRQAVAQYDQAKTLWLPNVYLGGSYYRHDGGTQGNSGMEVVNSKEQFLAGGGLAAVVSTADAFFTPLAVRQVVRSRTIDVQTARNDAILNVAEAYFNVQQARGQLAGAQDTVEKSRLLVRTVTALGNSLTAPIETDRARTQLADSEQSAALALEQWRIASADLTRALRLGPTSVVEPLEPPSLQVTLILPHLPVDTLVPIGLTNRPELASQQALVQATLARLRQERLRPLMPSILLGGDAAPAAPGGYLTGGVFGSDVNGSGNPWTGRSDVNVQLLWELRGLGLGNRALVRERRAEQEQAVIESYRIQDQVASDVAQAHAQLESATTRVAKAELGLKEAQINFAGNLKGMSETTRFGDLLTLVNRPQEVVSSLQQLTRAYDNYFLSINDFNRAQFRLYRAMGYPAEILSCQHTPGEVQQIDTTRLPQMAPVCAPEAGQRFRE